jgi:FkbM family methyltransferase
MMENSKLLYNIISKDKKHCRIIDVGACNLLTDNMKYFSQDADYEIMLIEPDPRQFELIERQLAKQEHEAEIHRSKLAVSTKLDVIDFVVSDIVGHSRIGNSNFDKAKPFSRNQKTIQVYGDTLENIASRYNMHYNLDFIKIDVEGMDEMVIKQAIKLKPIYIMAEHQDDPLRIAEQTKLLKNYVKVCDFDDSILWKIKR